VPGEIDLQWRGPARVAACTMPFAQTRRQSGRATPICLRIGANWPTQGVVSGAAGNPTPRVQAVAAAEGRDQTPAYSPATLTPSDGSRR